MATQLKYCGNFQDKVFFRICKSSNKVIKWAELTQESKHSSKISKIRLIWQVLGVKENLKMDKTRIF